jgi:hypothetical protein
MEVDLDLDNYDLVDLLKLFNLSHNFTSNELKESKKIVMMIHPDKSGLDKKYFLFYCKAFRILKNIYNFKNKKSTTLDHSNSTIEYLNENEEDRGKRLLINNLLQKDKKYFHEWFNKTFDKINIIDEERKLGYGNWFKSDEDIDTTETTLAKLHSKISEKKETLSTLIKVIDIEASNNFNSENYRNITGDAPDYYSSNIFSKLPYEDLKKAHIETVIPVGTNDYNNVLKFNSVENLRQYRDQQNIKPLSDEQSKHYINNRNNKEEENNIRVAHKLVRQDEITENANKSWWSNLSLLK